jgi:hypothetical protein
MKLSEDGDFLFSTLQFGNLLNIIAKLGSLAVV